MILTTKMWRSKFTLIVNYSQLDCDSENKFIKKQSKDILRRELSLINHLMLSAGYSHIQIPLGDAINLAKILTESLKGLIIVEVPLEDPISA